MRQGGIDERSLLMAKKGFHRLLYVIENMNLSTKLTIMAGTIIVPFVFLIIFLLVMLGSVGESYDAIVQNVTSANVYNIHFKEDMDSVMYQMVARSLEMDEVASVVSMTDPGTMIDQARASFTILEKTSSSPEAAQASSRVCKLLGTLETHVKEIDQSVKQTGSYEKNMERLETDIRIITELIQERITEYISYETQSMSEIREQTIQERNALTRMAALIFLFVLGVGGVFSLLITRSITRPIHKLCAAAEEIGRGHFDTRITIASHNELAIVGESFNRMARQITVLIADIKEEQIYNRNMEQKLLQSQINPHFLYNTLDNILWLSEAGRKEDVQGLVMALSQFFRTTLSGGRDIITLKEEISHVEAYLQIQKFRYRDILSYEINVPQDLMDVPVIKMTLQPLVENALYHGIKNKRGMGNLKISAFCREPYVYITVSDDGMGMKPEDLDTLRRMISGEIPPHSDNTGFGLVNVVQRLKLNFGDTYTLKIDSTYGEGTCVTVMNPAETVRYQTAATENT